MVTTDLVITVPCALKIRNKSNGVAVFTPYRENFAVALQAGKSVTLDVTTAGQALYYLEQGTADIEVTQVVGG